MWNIMMEIVKEHVKCLYHSRIFVHRYEDR